MTPRRRTARPLLRSAAAALTTLVLAAALGACDGGDEADDPGGPGSSTSSAGGSGPDDPTEPTESTDSTEPASANPLGTDAAPADGETVTIDALTLTLPKGWKVDSRTKERLLASPKEYNLQFLSIIAVRNDGRTSTPEEVLADYAEGKPKPPTVAPEPLEIDGVPMFYASGKVDPTTWVEAFGSGSTPYTVKITFDFSPKVTPAQERRELVDSVLATMDLTE